MAKANDVQIGGTHYQTDGDYQHWDLCAELYGEAHFKCTASKYVTRWMLKNGVQDLEKARHYLEKLVELVQDGFVVLTPCTRDYIKLYAEKMQGVPSREWGILCRIFAAENIDELKAEIKVINDLIAQQRQ